MAVGVSFFWLNSLTFCDSWLSPSSTLFITEEMLWKLEMNCSSDIFLQASPDFSPGNSWGCEHVGTSIGWSTVLRGRPLPRFTCSLLAWEVMSRRTSASSGWVAFLESNLEASGKFFSIANCAAVELLVSRLVETERLEGATPEFWDWPILPITLVGVTDFFWPRGSRVSLPAFLETLVAYGATFSWLASLHFLALNFWEWLQWYKVTQGKAIGLRLTYLYRVATFMY